eukprot:1762021-Rhodomonas_salina.1
MLVASTQYAALHSCVGVWMSIHVFVIGGRGEEQKSSKSHPGRSKTSTSPGESEDGAVKSNCVRRQSTSKSQEVRSRCMESTVAKVTPPKSSTTSDRSKSVVNSRLPTTSETED